MAKETTFDHPPKGHAAILGYDSSIDKHRTFSVDSSGRLEVVVATAHKYVDRGDPAAWDKTTGDLIIDSAWHDIDFSGIITDPNAVAVHVRVQITDDTIGRTALLRKNGNVNAVNELVCRTQAANISREADGFVSLDADLKVEYNITTGVDSAAIVVRGWLAPAG